MIPMDNLKNVLLKKSKPYTTRSEIAGVLFNFANVYSKVFTDMTFTGFQV